MCRVMSWLVAWPCFDQAARRVCEQPLLLVLLGLFCFPSSHTSRGRKQRQEGRDAAGADVGERWEAGAQGPRGGTERRLPGSRWHSPAAGQSSVHPRLPRAAQERWLYPQSIQENKRKPCLRSGFRGWLFMAGFLPSLFLFLGHESSRAARQSRSEFLNVGGILCSLTSTSLRPSQASCTSDLHFPGW